MGIFFNILGEDKGDYDVLEVFIEVIILLFVDFFGVEMLIFDIVVCIVNYFLIGNVKSWKFGLDWKVYEDLCLCVIKLFVLCVLNIGEFYGEVS